MADDNVKPSGFIPFFGVILTMEKRWTDMKTGGWKFFPSLQILSSWWIISFERPDLPRGLDPCYRAEEPSREEEETEKKKKLWKWTCQLSSLTLYFDLVHFAKTLEWSEELEHCIAYVNSGTIKKISNCTPVWLLHHCSGIISKSTVTLKIGLEEIGKL